MVIGETRWRPELTPEIGLTTVVKTIGENQGKSRENLVATARRVIL